MVVWFAPAVYYAGVLLIAAIVGTGVMTQVDNNDTVEHDGPQPVVPIFDPGPIDPVVVDDPTENGNEHPNVNPDEDDNEHTNEDPNQNEHPNENPSENPNENEYNNEPAEPEPVDPTEPDIYTMPKSSFGIYAEPPIYDDRAAIAFILTFISIFTIGMFTRKLWRACR